MDEFDLTEFQEYDEEFTANYSNGTDGYDEPGAYMHVPAGVQNFFIVLFSCTITFSVVGNVTVIVVLGCDVGKARTEINSFLINLAIADIFMAIFCMPATFTQTLYGYWSFGRVMCSVVLFLQQVSVCVSIYTLVALGIDRYFAVTRPLRRTTSSRLRIRLILAAIWIASLCLGIFQLVVAEHQLLAFDANNQPIFACQENWSNLTYSIVYEFGILTLVFFIPFVILCFTYTSIGLALWGRALPGNADKIRDKGQTKAKKKTIKMLVTVVFLFAICWLPLYIFNIILRFHPELASNHPYTTFLVFFGVYWLAMSNSFLNPIVYGFLNERFRKDVRRLLAMCKCFQSNCFAENKTNLYRRRAPSSYTTGSLYTNGTALQSSKTIRKRPEGKEAEIDI